MREAIHGIVIARSDAAIESHRRSLTMPWIASLTLAMTACYRPKRIGI
jgi:hypothetical protein